jgi:hypothetical protein
MLHVVEIRFADEHFQDVVLRVREWLNGENVQPTTFRYWLHEPESMMRVNFQVERQAKAFAEAFDGVVLPERAGLAPPNAASPGQD